jgi:predicted MFS family arabinose efflux permease
VPAVVMGVNAVAEWSGACARGCHSHGNTRARRRLARGVRTRSGTGFWLVAFAFLVAMAFSTVPTPLYALYQRKDGFSSFTVTVVFAAYAVGVAISLFLAGHLSDWLGRRRILLPALGLEVLAALVFLTWPQVPGLLVARLLTGFAVGMFTATATAHLAELHASARPRASRARADLVGTGANMGGLGAGTLVSGLLAQWAPAPLHTPFVVFLALLIVAALGVAVAPETVDLTRPRPRYHPQRMAAARGRYAAASGAAIAAFSILGLFTSLAPTFVAGTLHHPSRALAGAVAFLVFSVGAVSQIALNRVSTARQLTSGLTAMALGLPTIVVAVHVPSLAIFLVGGALAGAGSGLLLRGAIATVANLAAPELRGSALAGLFLAGYVGLAVPVLGLGIATRSVSLEHALLGFASFVFAVVAAVAVGLARTSGTPARL